jgi:hypothetical protein
MSERLKMTRNVAILLAIAAAVYFIPGGGRVAATFSAAIRVAFGIAIGLLGLWLYREQRVSLHSLGDLHRSLLYGAIALVLFLWVGRTRMWLSSGGELAWFVLAGIVVYSLLAVYRQYRSYRAY